MTAYAYLLQTLANLPEDQREALSAHFLAQIDTRNPLAVLEADALKPEWQPAETEMDRLWDQTLQSPASQAWLAQQYTELQRAKQAGETLSHEELEAWFAQQVNVGAGVRPDG